MGIEGNVSQNVRKRADAVKTSAMWTLRLSRSNWNWGRCEPKRPRGGRWCKNVGDVDTKIVRIQWELREIRLREGRGCKNVGDVDTEIIQIRPELREI